MTTHTTTAIDRPTWVDLASRDPAGSRAFYSRVLGWQIRVSEDPQFGGYGLAMVGDGVAAGIGGQPQAGAPTAWSVYIGTPDADALAAKVTAAGGTVIVPPFSIGDQGSMAVFQDPAGAFISCWEGAAMHGFESSEEPNTYAWAELNARNVEPAVRFYETVFGWTHTSMDIGEGQTYHTLQDGDQPVAGALEMNPMVPAEVPSYWLAYFEVAHIDTTHRGAIDAGAQELVGPQDFISGRFSILTDPQGATFGLLQSTPMPG